jgi:hypothetical protein
VQDSELAIQERSGHQPFDFDGAKNDAGNRFKAVCQYVYAHRRVRFSRIYQLTHLTQMIMYGRGAMLFLKKC